MLLDNVISIVTTACLAHLKSRYNLKIVFGSVVATVEVNLLMVGNF